MCPTGFAQSITEQRQQGRLLSRLAAEPRDDDSATSRDPDWAPWSDFFLARHASSKKRDGEEDRAAKDHGWAICRKLSVRDFGHWRAANRVPRDDSRMAAKRGLVASRKHRQGTINSGRSLFAKQN